MVRRSRSGFTLIELMIVVAILGILAAIAIPYYVTHVMNSRKVEAYTMLGQIKARQFSLFSDQDCFAQVSSEPAAVPPVGGISWGSVPTGNLTYCVPGPPHTMADLDIRPSHNLVYFTYACAVDPTAIEFSCNARADLDANGGILEIVFCTDNSGLGISPASPVAGSACGFPWEMTRASPDRF